MKPQIFLSYSRGDQGPAHQLARDLKDLGHAVWFDQDLTGGQAWWDQILARIRSADLFVFVLSSASLASIACQREYGYAAELRRPIVPVLVGAGLSLNVLPPALSRVQFIDFRERHVEAILALSRALRSLPVGVPLPDPLPAPPEVPISSLATLSQQIATPSALSFEEQSRLVLELKTALRDPATFQDARDLLGRLRVRRDLLATVAEEIDDVVVREPRGSGRVHLGKTSVGSSPFVSVIDGKNCWQLPSVPFSGVLNHQDGSSVNIAHPALPSFLKRRLTRVAGQKIWMHFLLWQIPFLHFLLVWVSGWDPFNFKNSALTLMLTAIPIGIVSAFLLFNLVPFLAAVAAFFSLLFSISYFLRDIDYSYNFVALLVLLVSGMMGGFLSRWSILSCRKKAVIP